MGESSLKNERVWLLGVFLLAFAMRLIYLDQIATNPFFDSPVIDALTYDRLALEIGRGNLLLRGETFVHAPLYPYFLALVYKAFGHNYYAARLIQILIGSFSCVLIYLLARKLFDRRVALSSSVIASFYGILIYFEGELLIPFLIVSLNLLAILLLLRAQEKPSCKRWFISGLILGLSAIARPNVLLFVLLIPIWIVFIFRKKKAKREILSYCASLGLATILVILPVTLRNYLVEKDFILISSEGGINFYLGNNPRAEETIGIRPGIEWKRLVYMPLREEGLQKPSERSRFFLKKAFQFIREEPREYLNLLFKKFCIFWNSYEIKRNQDIYFFRRYSPLLKILLWRKGIGFPFGVVAPLTLLGMSLCFKQWRRLSLLYLFILIYMTSVILFFVTSRYRVSAIPFLIIFGSYGLCWLFERIKVKDFSSLALSLLFLSIFFLLVNFNFYGVGGGDEAEEHYYLGFAHAERGRWDQAIREYMKALEIRPDFAEAYNNLGIAYDEKRVYEDGLRCYKRAIEIEPGFADAHNNLGCVYASRGELEKGIEEWKKALKLDPLHTKARKNLEVAKRILQEKEVEN